MTVRAQMGLGPWHVLQQGMALHLGISIGTGAIVVGAVLLLLAIWLREMPGLGTACAVVLTGVFLDLFLQIVAAPGARLARLAMMLVGLVVMTLGGAVLISARLGAHPLDSVMTGIYKRVPFSLYQVRVGLEGLGLTMGILAGGSAGLGSVVIGLGVGPCLQVWLQVLRAMPDREHASVSR